MGLYSSSLALNPTVLTVPGLGNSGPTHWQTLWEQSRLDTHRVELGMWQTPHRNAWVTKLDQAIAQAKAPVILVGHSLGCQAIAWWASLSPQPYGWPVAGALLVAPADVDRAAIPAELATFAPAPRSPLPFPSGSRSVQRTALPPTGAAISSTPAHRVISTPRVGWDGGRGDRSCWKGSSPLPAGRMVKCVRQVMRARS